MTKKHYERAAKEYVRCHGHWRFGINWPEGYVCRSCIGRATKITGRCPQCGRNRLLVGRNRDGEAICVDCAHILTCFRCATCGKEGHMWYSRTCVGCALPKRLRHVLSDGSARVAPQLVPLFERITSMPNPMAAMTWLNKEEVRDRLSDLARGRVPLSHEGIDTMAPGQGREFLRELLVEVGLLPYRDKYLAAFVAWQQKRLASIEEPEIRKEIRIYLAWRQHRNLAVRAEAGRVPARIANRARDQTDGAVRFLRFVSAREKSLAELSQDDVDAFFAEASNPMIAIDFLYFAVSRRRCPRVHLPEPRRQSTAGTPLAGLQAIAQRLLTDESLDLADRVAGLIVLLFAQTVTRVSGLRTCEFKRRDGVLTITLGTAPVVLPEPLAELVTRYLKNRSRTNTTNTRTDFVFPGGRPGEHLTAYQLTKRLNLLGITKAERQGALTHLVGRRCISESCARRHRLGSLRSDQVVAAGLTRLVRATGRSPGKTCNRDYASGRLRGFTGIRIRSNPLAAPPLVR